MTENSIVPSLNELMTAAQNTSGSEKSEKDGIAESKLSVFDAAKWYLQDYPKEVIIINKPSDSFVVKVKMYLIVILSVFCSAIKILLIVFKDTEKRNSFVNEFKENKQSLLLERYNAVCDEVRENKENSYENITEYIVVLNPKYIEKINSNQ